MTHEVNKYDSIDPYPGTDKLWFLLSLIYASLWYVVIAWGVTLAFDSNLLETLFLMTLILSAVGGVYFTYMALKRQNMMFYEFVPKRASGEKISPFRFFFASRYLIISGYIAAICVFLVCLTILSGNTDT